MNRREFVLHHLGRLGRSSLSPKARVTIDATRCLAHNNMLCSRCQEACPKRDVAFRLEAWHRPLITAGCTACGLCVPACPLRPSAVTVPRITSHWEYTPCQSPE